MIEDRVNCGAVWSKIELPPSSLDSIQAQSLWIWYPYLDTFKDHEQNKRNKKWKRVTPLQARQGLCLMGQFLPLYMVDTPDLTTEWWARSSDISYVSKLPLALAFSLPPEIEIDPQTHLIRTEQVRPPARIGDFGIVWSGKAPTIYPVTLLEEEGQQRCAKIHEILYGFLSSNSLSFDQWFTGCLK